MRGLVSNIQELEDKLKNGGGAKKIEKQHSDGKLTARERIAHLIDPGVFFLEIGLLIAYDRYDGQAPAAGVITGLGHIEKRPCVIVANDATVKAGAWWPETIHKILRAQEIAMRNRLPIVYLVDSAGVNLPYQDGISHIDVRQAVPHGDRLSGRFGGRQSALSGRDLPRPIRRGADLLL